MFGKSKTHVCRSFGVACLLTVACSLTLVREEQRLAAQEPSTFARDSARALQLNQEAIELARQGRFDEAITKGKRALELTRKIRGSKHRDVAADLFTLANFYMGKGDYFNAELLLREAISIDEELFGQDHPEVGNDLAGLGTFYVAKGDYAAAESTYQAARRILTKSVGNPKYTEHAASVSYNLGSLYVRMGENDLAIVNLHNAEQLYELIDRRMAIKVLTEMAELKRQLGEHKAAEQFLQRAAYLSQR